MGAADGTYVGFDGATVGANVVMDGATIGFWKKRKNFRVYHSEFHSKNVISEA